MHNNVHDCSQCRRSFTTKSTLHSHCIEQDDHLYCADCKHLFFDAAFLSKHLASTAHVVGGGPEPVTCYFCHRDYVHWGRMLCHCLKLDDHFFCNIECGRIFATAPQLQQHMKDTGHRHEAKYDSQFDGYDTFRCKRCVLYFESKADMDTHLDRMHNWCFECARGFKSTAHRDQHKDSIAHKPRTIKCALCPQLFKEPSSVALHVESGECTAGLDRRQVTQAVQALKVRPSILIGDDSDSDENAGEISDVTEIFSSATAASAITSLSYGTVTAEVATEDAFNGISYECPTCERTFGTLASLNLHLKSAAHDSDKFKCPDCSTQFTLLSGLIQHLESESCGAASISTVEREANLLTAQFARLLCGA
ncbi:hypothetical protein CYLTODRAFT_113225 [Cylindrobasidium torrendii FP15055 ss-10]|uniref:C2H2-type domain-containing protein n=1 Tax=Cylindrobasidium torrendii FP15055 ss-10 TaxID=1314674 RepID=A0A0D7B3M7_9AGAR|nr:hypothetical protein CYLTODRAFT_113225 [Cylindrobasidium torrendii FP15055 ss-10]